MQNKPDGELGALRVRAYGPNPDKHDAAAALLRLQTLEGAEHMVAPAAGTIPDRLEQGIADEGVHEPQAATVLIAPTPTARSRRRLRWWQLGLLWVASVAIAVALSAVISRAIVQRDQVDPQNIGATQVSRLSVDPDVKIPGFFTNSSGPNADPTAITAFTRFHGLQLIVSPHGYSSSFNQFADECLTVTSANDFAMATAEGFNGSLLSGCAANAFPATVTLQLSATSSRELRDAFGEGSGLQFVYDKKQSEIVVFLTAD